MYYGPRILESVEFAMAEAMGGAVLIGAVNSLFTGLAIWKVDSFGRRLLLLVGVGVAALALTAYVVSRLFPRMLSQLGSGGTFGLCALITFTAVAFIWRLLPETKGRTLEQIEKQRLKQADA